MNEYEIFVEAAEKEPAESKGFLDKACADHPEVRNRVEALLEAHRSRSFLDDLENNRCTWNSVEIKGYKLLEQIGEGAFGNVYMADQLDPVRRRVAVKVIKLGMDTKQLVARFDAERQAMAMMDHPNIARVYDAGATENGRPYFAMELVRGESITDYCDSQRLGTRDRLRLVVSVCRAIQHAHQKGVIHRDIKPSNVMVTMHDGKPLVKVIDFGIAKATNQPLTDKTLFTQFRQMVGTPAYMSPEQAELNSSDVDTRADVYSLGVLLYELVTGKAPLEFNQSNYEEMLRTIRETDPPSLKARFNSLEPSERSTIADKRRVASTELSRLVKGELNWIVAKALSKDRSLRYDTAAAFADDIDRYLDDLPLTATPPSAIYNWIKFIRRNRVLVGSASAVLTALVLGLLVAIAGLREAQNQAELARVESDKAIQQAKFAQAEREKAVAQAGRADATHSMLRDLLVTADPTQGYGPDYTVRELLDDFAESLPKRFDDTMPKVEAEIRHIIGNAYDRLAMRYDAEKFLRSAAEIRQSAKDVDYIRLAQTHSDFANNALQRCDPWQAQESADLAISAYKKAGTEVPENVIAILGQSKALCDVYQLIVEKGNQFRHHEVAPRVSELLDGSERLTGTLFTQIVFLLLDIGEYQEAIELCSIRPSNLGVKHSDELRNVRAIQDSILSIIYREHGMPVRASKLYPVLKKDADGDENWFRNNPWQKMILADAIINSPICSPDELMRASNLAKEFVEQIQQAKMPHLVGMANLTLATALTKRGEFEQASTCIEESLARIPENHMFLRGLLESQLASTFTQANELEKAELILREAVDWRRSCLPAKYVQNSVAEMNLAMHLLRHQPEPARSEATKSEAVVLLESALRRVQHRSTTDYFRTAIESRLNQLSFE